MVVQVYSRHEEVLGGKLMYILYKTQLIVQIVDYTSEETGTLEDNINKNQ